MPAWIIFCIFFSLLGGVPVSATAGLVNPGDNFPELRMPAPADPDQRAYLEIPDGAVSFTPKQVKGEVLLVELLNVHCPHCQMQAPSYNELFKLIEGNPQTRGKIKMLAIGAGNLPREVEAFRSAYGVKFPLIADPRFVAWKTVGGSGTPLTIVVRQDPDGPGVISSVHQGMNTHYQQIFTQLQQLASRDPEDMRQTARSGREQNQQVAPVISDTELEYRLRSAFTKFGGIADFRLLKLLSGRRVYTAMVRQEGSAQRLFAEVTSRSSVCDICHDVHFFYLFDRSGRVIAFEPLQLTKYGNVNWTDQEVETMRRRVMGRYLSMPQPFDPSVDAISSATMTSAIIFDSLADGGQLLQELRDQGLL